MVHLLFLYVWLAFILSMCKGLKSLHGNPIIIAGKDIRFADSGKIVSALPPVDVTWSAGRTAITAIARVVGVCGIGVSGAKAGLLTDNSLAVLSQLTFSMFQPCLLFTNVATTVANARSNQLGGYLYILPLAAIFQISVGYLVGKGVSSVVYRGQQDGDAAKQLLVCTTFSNSGPLPLVLIDSLFRNHGGKTLVADGTACVSMYLLCFSPLFWIIAPAVLAEVGQRHQTPFSESAQKKPSDRRRALLNRVLSPPVIGSLSGLCVGCTAPLRDALVSPQGLLNPMFEAARTVGSAFIPAALLVLAGSLVAGDSPASSESAQQPLKQNDTSQLIAVQVACIYAVRFISFGLAILASRHLPAVHDLVRRNPLLLFVLLLETCMPSAQNSTVIYQLQGRRDAARRLAKVLMLVYVLGIPAMAFWLVRILNLTGLARIN